MALRTFPPASDNVSGAVAIAAHAAVLQEGAVAGGAEVVVCEVGGTVIVGRGGEDDLVAHVAVHIDGEVVVA